MDIDVSIIIVNYKSSILINDCIRSIFEKTEGISYEIIVVDNATEDLSQVLDAFGDERVTTLQLKENVGFGRANNAGAELAKGRNLFLLNPDTVLINNAVKILSDYLDEHPEAGACGANLFDRNMRPTSSYRRFFPGVFWEVNDFALNKLEPLFYRNHIFNFADGVLEVKYVVGAALLVRRTDFFCLNGFCSDYFMYFEETDLCYRIRKNLCKRNVNVPMARIQHLEGGTTGEDLFYIFVPRKHKLWEYGRRVFLQRNRSKLIVIIANLVLRLNFLTKSILLPSKKGRDAYRGALRIHLDEWKG